MSYFDKNEIKDIKEFKTEYEIEYEIILNSSFKVLRGCPKCGRKRLFVNTRKFRVNANGGRLDIWLIYQCEDCRHTLNLAVYERQKVSAVPKKEYQRFLDNDEQLAGQYGRDLQLFRKNRAEIDLEGVDYGFAKLRESGKHHNGEQILLTIYNPYQLKIRPEKQLAAVLGRTRSQIKNMLDKNEIELVQEQLQVLSVRINACDYQLE